MTAWSPARWSVTLGPGGIALAAIQSLSHKVDGLAAETADLSKENRELRAKVQRLTSRLSAALMRTRRPSWSKVVPRAQLAIRAQ